MRDISELDDAFFNMKDVTDLLSDTEGVEILKVFLQVDPHRLVENNQRVAFVC